MTPSTPPTAARPLTPTQRPVRLLLITALTLTALTGAVMLLAPKQVAPHDFRTADHPTLGSVSAPNDIVLFVDYKCPACRAFEMRVLPQLNPLFTSGRARLIAMQSPFLAPDSRNAANAAVCAYAQDQAAFWRMNGALFARQADEKTVWATRPVLEGLAQEQHLDLPAFQACLLSGQTDAAVTADLAQHTSAGFVGTPAVFVNGVRVEPSLTAIRAALTPTAP